MRNSLMWAHAVLMPGSTPVDRRHCQQRQVILSVFPPGVVAGPHELFLPLVRLETLGEFLGLGE